MSGQRPDHDALEGRRPLRRVRVADQVFDALAESLLAGDFPPGASLPSERALADQFDVSRLLVRQALHRLADLGLIKVRQGGATTAADPTQCDHPGVGVLALRFGPQRADAVRALRERQIAGGLSIMLLAARRVTPADVEILSGIVDAFESGGDEADSSAFWTTLADITRNPFFQRETRYWSRVIREHDLLRQRPHLAPAQRVLGLRHLVRALAEGEGVLEAYAQMASVLLDRLDDGG